MAFTITNQNSAETFEADASESVLDAALRQGRVFPYSCRSGSCGTCKAKLVSGEVDSGKFTDAALSAQEQIQGQILLCQSKALSDLTIEARELAAEEGAERRAVGVGGERRRGGEWVGGGLRWRGRRRRRSGGVC